MKGVFALRAQADRMSALRLHLLEGLAGKLIFNVAGIQRRSGFEQHDFAFFLSKGPVLDAARDNYQFAGFDPFFAIAAIFAIIHAKTSFHYQEQLVFMVVMMPGEWSLEFNELNQLAVELTGDARIPVIVDERKLLGEIDLVHHSSFLKLSMQKYPMIAPISPTIAFVGVKMSESPERIVSACGMLRVRVNSPMRR